ncbi:MAG: iron chelate uptake ABC transporter family permease subunit [Candidatus Nanopelagicales bacterium]
MVTLLLLLDRRHGVRRGAALGPGDDDPGRIPDWLLTFWSSGSLALSTWPAVTSVLPFALIGGATAAYVARSLDVLALGDRSAATAGVDVRRVRIAALAAVVLLVGAGVGAIGVIAFVGLLVPHAVRAVLGLPRHRGLLLVSALAGFLLLLVADTRRPAARRPAGDPDRRGDRGDRGTGLLRAAAPDPCAASGWSMTGDFAASLRAASVRTGGRDRLLPTTLSVPTGTVTAIVGATRVRQVDPSSACSPARSPRRPGGPRRRLARLVAHGARARPPAHPARPGHTSCSASPCGDVVVGPGAAGRGTPQSADDDAVVAAAIAAQGLEDLVDRPVTSLSGGERKRVHIARVTAQQADLLLLDEADSDPARTSSGAGPSTPRPASTPIAAAPWSWSATSITRISHACDRVVLLRAGC